MHQRRLAPVASLGISLLVLITLALVWPSRMTPARPPHNDALLPSASAVSSASAGPSAPSDPTVLPAHAVPFGAFLGSDESDARIAEFSAWLNGARIQVGHTYLPGNHWADIEGSIDLLAPWARWRLAQPDRMLVLAVPMQEDNEGGLSDGQVRSLLTQGASGAFDRHFLTLARRLVALGATDTVITLGWEMNGDTYTSRCHPDPADWRTYWRRIVTIMRSVPGQSFRFDFNPTRGTDDNPWTECYPGDDVTDVIGMDSYDLGPGRTFDDYVNEPYGLQQQVDFALAHHKPVSYPEWGMFQYGDDPTYVQHMLDWMATHDTLYQTITDYCPHGVWGCSGNPQARAVFAWMMSATDAPSASPSPSPTATPSGTPSPSPTPSAPTAVPAPTTAPGAPTSAAPTAPVTAPSAPLPTAVPAPTPCHRPRRGYPRCPGAVPAPVPQPAPSAGPPLPRRSKLPGKS